MTRAKAWMLGLVTSVAVVGTALAAIVAPSQPTGPTDVKFEVVTTYTTSVPWPGVSSVQFNWGDGTKGFRYSQFNGTIVGDRLVFTDKHAWNPKYLSQRNGFYANVTAEIYDTSPLVKSVPLMVLAHP